MADIGSIPKFNYNRESQLANVEGWRYWTRMFKNFIKAQAITDEERKVAIFRVAVGFDIEEMHEASIKISNKMGKRTLKTIWIKRWRRSQK